MGAEEKAPRGHGKTASAAAAGAGAGAALTAVTLTPELAFEILKWLQGSLGSVGLVLIIGFGVALTFSVIANIVMWNRQKEKDDECRTELRRQREAWKAVVDGKDADNKEIALTVKDLLVQVTRLTERAAIASVRTRSSS